MTDDSDRLAPPALSRRSFLTSSAAATGAGALSLTTRIVYAGGMIEPEDSVVSDDALPKISLVVNGHTRTLAVEPRTTLVEALRDTLGLTGTKIGCNHGQCGACTVLLDGRRVNACLVLALSADNAKITTVEGLADPVGNLHPMQSAFAEYDALQCGYCTPGQIISAIGCLEEGHAGSAAEIREYMSGNLCRCGAYPNIVKAIEAVRDGTLAPLAGGSVTSASAGSAVHLACMNIAAEVARTLVELQGNPFSGLQAASISLEDGMLTHPDGKTMPLLDALEATPRGEVTADGKYAHPDLTTQALLTTYKGGYGVAGPVTETHAMFAFGAEFAEGIGELGIVGTAAAIANAIHHATGKRLRSLPFTIAHMV